MSGHMYPTTVKSSPLSENFCPEVLTKPVGAGVGALPAELDTLVGAELDEGGATLVTGGALDAPGRHWK